MKGSVRRASVMGAAAALAFLGAGSAALALHGTGSSPPPASQEAPQVTADDPTTTTAAPASPPLQPGFEDYTPGDALPAPPPAPTPENPTVSTVPGPYGPIYPEGYVDPNIPTPQAPQIVPVQPPSERGGTADVGG